METRQVPANLEPQPSRWWIVVAAPSSSRSSLALSRELLETQFREEPREAWNQEVAKEECEPTASDCGVSMMGHIDHGKTTFTEGLISKIFARDKTRVGFRSNPLAITLEGEACDAATNKHVELIRYQDDTGDVASIFNAWTDNSWWHRVEQRAKEMLDRVLLSAQARFTAFQTKHTNDPLSDLLARDTDFIGTMPIGTTLLNGVLDSKYFVSSPSCERKLRTLNTKLANAFDMFFDASLSWIEHHYAIERVEDIVSARLLKDDLAWFVKVDERSKRDPRFKRLSSYVRTRRPDVACRSSQLLGVSDFDGLILYLAATFKGSLDWIGEDRTTRNVFLVSLVFDALEAIAFGLSSCDISELSPLRSRAQIRERILQLLLLRHRLKLKQAALDGLNGCLVRTPFGSSIYVHEELSGDRREWVTLHELGHFLFDHRPRECFGDRLIESDESDQDSSYSARQEREADGFANVWQHVLKGLVEHLSRTRSFLAKVTAQSTDAA